MKTQNEKSAIPSSLERAIIAANIINDNKGEEIKVLDLRELTPSFDFFVIGSGSSRRQLHGISEEIDDYLEKKLGDSRRSISGYQDSRWIVLDYDDVVIHLFDPEKRDFYALEDLWGKAVEIDWKNASFPNIPSSDLPANNDKTSEN